MSSMFVCSFVRSFVCPHRDARRCLFSSLSLSPPFPLPSLFEHRHFIHSYAVAATATGWWKEKSGETRCRGKKKKKKKYERKKKLSEERKAVVFFRSALYCSALYWVPRPPGTSSSLSFLRLIIIISRSNSNWERQRERETETEKETERRRKKRARPRVYERERECVWLVNNK